MNFDPQIAKILVDVRNDPIALHEVLFSARYTLPAHLRHIYREIESHQFTWIQAARAAGKSYGVGGYIALYALRYPKTRIIISGPSYRQSRLVWNYARELIFEESWFDWDDFLSKEPTQSTEESKLVFRNGSEIIALPASGTKLHGKRGSVLVLTEFFDYPEQLYNMTVLPMLAKRMAKDRENKIIYETTAGFEFQFAYRVYKDFLEKVDERNPSYGLVSIPLAALLRTGWQMEMSVVKTTFRIDRATGDQQYNCKWLTDSGSFYVLSVMAHESIRRGEVLLRGDPKREYVVSLDTARSRRGKGDDSAISVVEVGRTPRVVYLWSINNVTSKRLAKEVHRVVKMFEQDEATVVAVVLDPQGGGEFVMDDLRDLKDDLGRPCGYILKDEPLQVEGRRLIVAFPNTSEEINRAHQELRSAFENARIATPGPLNRLEDERQEIIKADEEIKAALKQLSELTATQLPSGYLKFEAPRGSEKGQKKKKDKAYSLLYAFWGVQRRIEELLQTFEAELGDGVVNSSYADVIMGVKQ